MKIMLVRRPCNICACPAFSQCPHCHQPTCRDCLKHSCELCGETHVCWLCGVRHRPSHFM